MESQLNLRLAAPRKILEPGVSQSILRPNGLTDSKTLSAGSSRIKALQPRGRLWRLRTGRIERDIRSILLYDLAEKMIMYLVLVDSIPPRAVGYCAFLPIQICLINMADTVLADTFVCIKSLERSVYAAQLRTKLLSCHFSLRAPHSLANVAAADHLFELTNRLHAFNIGTPHRKSVSVYPPRILEPSLMYVAHQPGVHMAAAGCHGYTARILTCTWSVSIGDAATIGLFEHCVYKNGHIIPFAFPSLQMALRRVLTFSLKVEPSLHARTSYVIIFCCRNVIPHRASFQSMDMVARK